MTLRLTEFVHTIVQNVVRPGDVVVDATVGNGHDTRFLADLVGPAGVVYGFDIQSAAWDRFAAYPQVRFIRRNHAEMKNAIDAGHQGHVAAVLFNLGYLPGGDHTVTTKPETTLPALAAAVELLKPVGILTVLTYRGHPGGREEAEAVGRFWEELSKNGWDVSEYPSASEDGPVLYVAVS
jgi:predicted methyltransferase